MNLIGHEQTCASFYQAIAAGRMHHAWLFHGPRGIGKATAARMLANKLLCGAEIHTIDNYHADFYCLSREQGEAPSAIGVDEVRELLGFLRLTPVSGPYKVAIIDSADNLTLAAANALLKMLEEPPASAVIILIAHAAGRLLPTIRSRCRHLLFHSLSLINFERILQLHSEQEQLHKTLQHVPLPELYKMCHGSAGLALQIISTNSYELLAKLQEQVVSYTASGAIKIAEMVQSSAALWPILQHGLVYFLQQKIKEYAHSSKLMQYFADLDRCQEVLEACNNLHLDKSAALISVLSK